MCEACLQVTMLIQRNEECRPRCGIFGLYYLIYFNKGGQIYGYTHTHCKHKCFNETYLKKCNVAWHVFENWYQLLSLVSCFQSIIRFITQDKQLNWYNCPIQVMIMHRLQVFPLEECIWLTRSYLSSIDRISAISGIKVHALHSRPLHCVNIISQHCKTFIFIQLLQLIGHWTTPPIKKTMNSILSIKLKIWAFYILSGQPVESLQLTTHQFTFYILPGIWACQRQVEM